MPISGGLALVLSMLAVWLASPAADWRYVSWGAQNAEYYFSAAILSLLISTGLIGLSMRGTGRVLVIAISTLVILVLGEMALWALLDSERPIIARQMIGLAASPVAILAAMLALRSKKTPQQRSLGQALLLAGSMLGAGLVVVAALLFYRQTAVGGTYDMLQVATFAVFAISAASAIAALATHFYRPATGSAQKDEAAGRRAR